MRLGSPNQPAAPNAGIASQLKIEHHRPGVGDLGHYAIMQSPQDFIREYLKEQLRLQELWGQAWLPVRNRFFQPDYNAFDPQQNIDRVKAEIPLETSESEGTAVVTTSGYGDGHRLRYTLHDTSGAWRICRIELECGICRGTGKYKERVCKLCKGEGWKSF